MALILTAPVLAGCGRGATTQSVAGDGFRFEAPGGWTVAPASASKEKPYLLKVSVFRLLKPYRPAIKEAAIRELDDQAAALARDAHATIVSRQTLVVDKHDARSYELGFADHVEELTFVFVDRLEYELICSLPKGADTAPCELLRSTFTLT